MSWKTIRLGEIAVEDRRIIPPESAEATSRPYLGLDQIESGTGRVLSYESNSTEGKSTTFAFDESHVLYGKLRPYLNKVVAPSRSGRCSTEIIPLLPRDVDREFLAYLLRTDLVVDAAMSEKTGSRMPRADMDVLLDLEVSIPETDHAQRQIAARLKAQLAEVETARQAAQVQLRDADALRAAIYRQAFRSVVPVAVPPRFQDAPDGWQWHKLADIARLESGHTPSRHRPDWWGGDVSWISLTEIRALDGRWVESTQLRTNAEGIANSSARILPRGTVCYSRTASVGFVCIMAAPMSTSQDFANWVCGHELEPEFLMHALICSRKELREIATGATHKTIYMPQLESFHLCAPDINDQRHIVTALKQQLAQADVLRGALEQQLRDLDALPQRILALAFQSGAPVA
jgi:type I restriction enzyme S subunit